MQCKAQLGILRTLDFKLSGASGASLAPLLSDNPHGMLHVVFDFDQQLLVSNPKQQFVCCYQ